MSKKIFLQLYLSAMMVLLASTGASAQVTIGSSAPPNDMSLLYLDASTYPKALHLPRLTGLERDALVSPNFAQSVRDLAVGLMIYNIETQCVEFWSGSQWISLCAGDTPDPCAGLANLNAVFCAHHNPTIDSLTVAARAAGGRGIIQWFAAATGGGALPLDHPLTNNTEYWAGNCAGGGYPRIPVRVTLANCAPIIQANIRVTTFVNVMYDFQHQTLETFTTSGGEATSWQWQVATVRDGAYTDIPGATSATFTVPANFIHNPAYNGLNELFFRSVLTNPINSEAALPTNALGIRFIRTTDGNGNLIGNYGMDANGVRYLTIRRGGSLNGGQIKVALLNLGASGTGAWLNGVHIPDNGVLNDAGDLGDFYQWGRVADGHQHTVWNKNPATRVNQILPMEGGGTATSAIINNTIIPMNFDANGQVTNSPFLGSFIFRLNNQTDWGAQNLLSNSRWGDGSTGRPGTGWSHPTNNPCPAGWRVPSRWEFWDINNGTGTNSPPSGIINWNAQNNTWEWHPSRNDAVGGVLITNQNNEVLFLPAVGWRVNTGVLNGVASGGGYWSSNMSSTGGNMTHGHALFFNIAGPTTDNSTSRAHGFSVRCVAE